MLLFTAASFTGSSEPITGVDSDGDGLLDTEEDKDGDNLTKGDTNNNDVMDKDEKWEETSILNPDSDGDGIIDSEDDHPLKKAADVKAYSQNQLDKEETANSLLNIFLFVLLLSFAIFSLIAGIFTAYFGAGKSRAIGGALLVLGLIVILVWLYFGVLKNYPDDSLLGIVHWEAAKTIEAFITVISAIIGAVIAIVLFLVAIMKS